MELPRVLMLAIDALALQQGMTCTALVGQAFWQYVDRSSTASQNEADAAGEPFEPAAPSERSERWENSKDEPR
jgi:hypothetical protein